MAIIDNGYDQRQADSELDHLVKAIHEAGVEWINAKLKADQLHAGLKNVLARIMTAIEKAADGKVSEVKLERLARCRDEWKDYEPGVYLAHNEYLLLKNRFDGLEKQLDAKRSQYVTQRTLAKIEQGGPF